MDRFGIPYTRPGQVIGLFGGSFDPPHQGHVHVTLEAMKAFGLDRVWWLVSPGNPLKERGPAPSARRMAAAREMMQHPRVEVTDIEALTGTRATADTLAAMRRLYPQVRFVWLMGADNLAQFHRWKDWRQIMDSVPVGVVARPGDRISARMSPAARAYAQYRIDGQARYLLGRAAAPAWCFVNVPMINVSSTEIRGRGGWGDGVLPE
ncbi:nicotinate-nucleotide adenylyltransferase [uncultured Ruegeria sp.]|uniref:nicotinate-nucleotide adenylyltransferase n=1 Tax=uncultured Ruegeria sp. TaxID=259304 RepID=UPI00262E1753|nr:nicotinate-nucleotide adenylyltransferase [uncultured Ruegeria sp.]